MGNDTEAESSIFVNVKEKGQDFKLRTSSDCLAAGAQGKLKLGDTERAGSERLMVLSCL